ncbi:amidinotransferase [Bosea sp. Root381]|uniref:citrulline utilization hydrolase CtlX n=1 Tax=Bosea sp. Root381 TaxID=1736524 RepID=UPI0006FEFE70|nr:arginine deiminase-related protein [Bosea sp. Root381]KRE08023.1 amidinotransferase [Bosea sp. Root381]
MKAIRPSVQAPADVVMIRPHHFTVNTETALDNRFQQIADAREDLSRAAFDEITRAVETLRGHGVRVLLFEDRGTQTPDSVFPNNWFSTHAGGHVAIYPMKTASRRRERRADVIEMLKAEYRVQDVIDYSGLEPDGLFLEGTGAMVLDHIDRVAYAVQSERTNPIALERFCTHFNFEPMVFAATDRDGVPIYHTNVLMCIGTDHALVGLSLISDPARRAEIVARLQDSGRSVITLSEDQIAQFAGNALELRSGTGNILVMSTTARASLDPRQLALIEQSTPIVALEIPTIERAGGSVRCTIAGLHLSRRKP